MSIDKFEDFSADEVIGEDLIFSEEELRALVEAIAPNTKIQKKALITLGEYINDIGYSIIKLALGFLHDDPTAELTQDVLLKAAKRYASLSVPMIHYVWIINGNGTCLFSKSYSGLLFPDTIFSGLLLGIANMVTEVSGRTLDKLVIGDLTINIQEVNPLLCAVISDDSRGIASLVKELAKEFLKIYGHRVNEPAVDINAFKPFEKHARAIIRNWGIAMPTDAAGDAVTKLLDPEIIRQGVISAAQQKDLKNAMLELKGLPVFNKESTESSLDVIIDSKLGSENNQRVKPGFIKSQKSGKELITDIFSAVAELRNSTKRDLSVSENLEDDLLEKNDDA